MSMSVCPSFCLSVFSRVSMSVCFLCVFSAHVGVCLSVCVFSPMSVSVCLPRGIRIILHAYIYTYTHMYRFSVAKKEESNQISFHFEREFGFTLKGNFVSRTDVTSRFNIHIMSCIHTYTHTQHTNTYHASIPDAYNYIYTHTYCVTGDAA
jgi:hypothetical protein